MSEEDKQDLEKAAAIHTISETPEFPVLVALVEEIREMYNATPEQMIRMRGEHGDVEADDFKVARFVGAREGLGLLLVKIGEATKMLERHAKVQNDLAAEKTE